MREVTDHPASRVFYAKNGAVAQVQEASRGLGGAAVPPISIRRGSFAAPRNDFCVGSGAQRRRPEQIIVSLQLEVDLPLANRFRCAERVGSN